MDTISTDEITHQSCAIMDGGSVLDFFGRGKEGLARERVQHLEELKTAIVRAKSGGWGIPSALADQIGQNKDVQRSLLILERIICYDYIVLDHLALRAFDLEAVEDAMGISGIFRTLKIPVAIYESAAEQIKAHRAVLAELDRSDPRAFSSGDKELHDALHGRSDLHAIGFSFANSDETAERALFYLEVARAFSAPVILSPQKSILVQQLGKQLRGELHTKISQAVSEAFAQVVGSVMSLEVAVPPLWNLIFARAIEAKESVLQAAVNLRKTTFATEYRVLLRTLQAKLASGLLGAAETVKALRDIRQLADRWVTTAEPRLGLEYTRRSIKLEKVPGLGWLEALGGKSLEMKDPALTRIPGYLIFIANWFDPHELLVGPGIQQK
jgi:hypothetical protein